MFGNLNLIGIGLWFVVLALLSSSYASTKTYTLSDAAYNGTLTYKGFFVACAKTKAIPCDSMNTIDGFVENSLPKLPFWVLSLGNEGLGNCLGYANDSVETMGTCGGLRGSNYFSVCSCNIYMAVCCVTVK